MEKGFYLVFEGLVGSGKTTQSKLLLANLETRFPGREILWTKEPGGSEIANAIRKVVQGTVFTEEMDPVCEQFLYAASRSQTTRKIISPVLERGGIVLADRSVFTSMVNQGYGRGLGLETVLEINKQAVAVWPDKVIFVDTDLDLCLSRAKDGQNDKFELLGREFHERVRQGYVEVAKKYPRIVCTVDGNGSIDQVQERILAEVIKWLR